jgi:hypothetical protein
MSAMGAVVQYCGHNGCFVADLFDVENVVVVRANGPVTGENLIRDGSLGEPTHHLVDFPAAGFWRPQLGVFVIPKKQIKTLK